MLDPAMWRWGLPMLANCTEARYRVNKSRMVRLAEYSRDCLSALRDETGIDYDERAQGTLQLFRTQKQLDGIAQGHRDPAGVRRALRGARPRRLRRGRARARATQTSSSARCGCPATKPATASSSRSGSPRWRSARRDRSASASASSGSRRRASAITGVRTDAGLLTADRTCSRSAATRRACSRRSASRLPVYPVKGYSITVPITDAAHAPESTIMDETHKVAVTRLGDRIRVGGTAELSGFDLQLHEARRRTLEHVVTDLFPRGGDVARAEFWTGLRPMTPDGTPIVGPTRYPNLLPGHRPRHARLDDGGRHRPRDGRLDGRSTAGDFAGRPDDRAIYVTRSRASN